MSAFDRPILAIGMPRSGTTWIGKILDSHPRTLYRHEPDTWRRLDTIPLFPAPSARLIGRSHRSTRVHCFTSGDESGPCLREATGFCKGLRKSLGGQSLCFAVFHSEGIGQGGPCD